MLRRLWRAFQDWRYQYMLDNEPTYCDGCKKFSRGVTCPYCPEYRRGS